MMAWEQLRDLDELGVSSDPSPWACFLGSLSSLDFQSLPQIDSRGAHDSWHQGSDRVTTALFVADPSENQHQEAPAMLMILLWFLSNNQFCSSGAAGDVERAKFVDSAMISLLERLGSTGLGVFKTLLSRHDRITEAIRDRAFVGLVRAGRLDLLRIMLDVGVDINMNVNLQAVDWEKQQPLQFAVGIGDEDTSLAMARLFLNHGARVDGPDPCPPQKSPLCLAIARNHHRVVDLLLASGASLTAESLIAAIKISLGGEDVETSCDEDEQGEEQCDQILQKLMKAGADINGRLHTTAPITSEVTIIGWAAVRKEYRLVERLIAFGVDVNAPQTTQCFRLLPSCAHYGFPGCKEPVSTTALGLAIAFYDDDMVKLLQCEGKAALDPLPDNGHRCPLLIASAHRRLELILELLDAGASAPRANTNAMAMNCHPMSLSESIGPDDRMHTYKNIRLILEWESSEGDSRSGKQGLSLSPGDFARSVEQGDIDEVRWHLEGGAIPKRMVTRIGSEEVLNLLHDRNILSAITGQNGPNILSAAILGRKTTLATRLIACGIQVTHSELPTLLPVPLDAAVLKGDLELIKSLIERQAPYTSRTLKLAVEARQAENILHVLLPHIIPMAWRIHPDDISDHLHATKTPSIDYSTQTLTKAAELGRRAVLQMLLRAVNWGPVCISRALASTILLGSHSCVQDLLDAGAQLQECALLNEATDKNSAPESVWHAALISRQVWIVEAFIKAGVNVNQRLGPTGGLPLAFISRTGDIEIAEALIKAGAAVNPEPSPSGGATALQLAAIHNHVALARKLIDAGADVNAKDTALHGRTALEGAAEHGHLDMLHLLLGNGAGIYDDHRPQYVRAVGLAQREGFNAAANMLKARGGWTADDEAEAPL